MKEKSYFYYNISEHEFENAFYVKATRKNYWTIPVKSMTVNNNKYKVTEALIDTGTSLMTLPPSLYTALDQEIFASNCDRYSQYYMRKCDCTQSSYPNISIISSGIQFNITPDMYLFSASSVRGCYLGIQPLNMPFIILGDVFLQHNTVIFRKQTN